MAKKASQQSLIPPAWRVSDLPDSTVLDVTAFPEQCGILSEQEIAVTNSHVGDLLHKLASAEWSAVDVVTAFYKRAIIAHQLVRFPIYVPSLRGVLMRAAIRQIVLRRSLSRRPSRVQPSLMTTFERMGQ